MNLPQRMKRHQYDFKKSNGSIIKFTPWLVRDEQEFMYATEGIEDKDYKIPHIEELLNKCVDDEINFDMFSDLDFLRFAIEVRKLSKGSEHEVTFTCPNCNTINEPSMIDLDGDVSVIAFSTSPIDIGNMSFAPREVTRGEITEMKNIVTNAEKRFQYVVHSISAITVDDEIHANLTLDEISEFVGTQLLPEEWDELSAEILKASPSVSIEKNIQCAKCGLETLVFVNNITDFFE